MILNINIMDSWYSSIQRYVKMDKNNYTTNAALDNPGFYSVNPLTHLLDEDPNEFPFITLSE